MKKLGVVLCVVMLVLGMSNQAIALTIATYTNVGSFLTSAGPGLAHEDFEGFGDEHLQTLDSTTSQGPINPGDIPSGIKFSSTGGNPDDLFIAPAGFSPNIVTDALFADLFQSPLIVDFDPGVTAYGADIISWPDNSLIGLAVTDDTGVVHNYNVNTAPGPSAFLGFIITGGTLTSLSYTPGDLTVGIDNVYFGNAVPEPGTMFLFGAGLIALFALGRKKFKK